MYARRKRDVEASTVRIKEEYISKWLLYFGSGKDAMISGTDGRSVIIPGRGDFRGQIQDQFWDGVEPLIENTVVTVLQGAQNDVATFGARFQAKHLDETRYLLQEKLVRSVYDDMQTADQNLRGKNNPKKVLLRNIEDKLDKFDKFIKGETDATQKLLNKSTKKGLTRYIVAFLLGAIIMFILILIDTIMAPKQTGTLPPPPSPQETLPPIPEKPGAAQNIFSNFSQMFKEKAEKEQEKHNETAVFPGMTKDTNPNAGLNPTFGTAIQKPAPSPKPEEKSQPSLTPTEKKSEDGKTETEKAKPETTGEKSAETPKKTEEIKTIHEEPTNPFASLSHDNTPDTTASPPSGIEANAYPNPVTQPPDLDGGIGDAPAGLDLDKGLGGEPAPNDLDAGIEEDVAEQENRQENAQVTGTAPKSKGS